MAITDKFVDEYLNINEVANPVSMLNASKAKIVNLMSEFEKRGLVNGVDYSIETIPLPGNPFQVKIKNTSKKSLIRKCINLMFQKDKELALGNFSSKENALSSIRKHLNVLAMNQYIVIK